MTPKPSGFYGMSNRLWGRKTVCALDAGTTVCSTVAKGGLPAIVILGPDFKFLYQGGHANKGNFYVMAPGNPPLNFVAFENGLGKCKDKGLLGGLKVPAAAKRLISAVKAAQLSNVLAFLKSLPDKGEPGKFKKELTKRIEALQVQKRKLFDSFDKAGKKWLAYKAGASYLRVFPGAKDLNEVRGKVGKLQYDKDVRKELLARQNFRRALVLVYGPRRKAVDVKNAAKYFKQIATHFKGTEFGKMAAKMAAVKMVK